MSGRIQAVRLPKEFWFEGTEVGIKRVGSGVLLFPRDKPWDMMAQAIGRVDEDFMARRDQPERGERRKPL
jgi:antitoxin VapB